MVSAVDTFPLRPFEAGAHVRRGAKGHIGLDDLASLDSRHECRSHGGSE